MKKYKEVILLIDDPVAEDTEILHRALETARAAAFAAGDSLRERRGKAEVVRKKASRDDLLDADLIAEDIIIRKLRDTFPDHEILSEETQEEKKDTVYRWVVDPLDGSANFQHGNPTFAISISLLIENITMVGVVYLPLQEEMFAAIRGYGAQMNNEPIHVSGTSKLDDAIVHVGDFAKDGNSQDNKVLVNDLAHLANAVYRVRMIGTAATDLAYVACGRADALVLHSALPWDIEVGCLLVTEAGGTVSVQKSGAGKLTVISSNGSIQQELLEVIPKEEYSYSRY